MTRGLTIEIDDAGAIDTGTADRIGNLLHRLVESEGAVSRIRVEIDSTEDVVEPLIGRVNETATLDQSKDPNGPDEGATDSEPTGDENVDPDDSQEQPAIGDVTLNPGTRRWVLGAILYHASETISVADAVELSQGTDWEMNESSASAELYNMFQDDIVDRVGSPYQYDLTDLGAGTLERRAEEESIDIEPNPFG